jgi:EKC/KEOPS complex subunit PCC1/LAGE3
MLRVAVNSFMEGLKLVLEVMEQLDVDVLAADGQKSLIQSA